MYPAVKRDVIRLARRNAVFKPVHVGGKSFHRRVGVYMLEIRYLRCGYLVTECLSEFVVIVDLPGDILPRHLRDRFRIDKAGSHPDPNIIGDDRRFRRRLRRFLHRFRLCLLRIRRTADDSGGTDNERQRRYPNGRLFPAQRIFNPRPDAALAESQRSGRRKTSARGKGKQRCRVKAAVRARRFEHSFVTAHLHVAAHEAERKPHKRIKPVHRQYQKRKGLYDMIEASQMIILVRDNIRPFALAQTKRNVYFGVQKSHDKW